MADLIVWTVAIVCALAAAIAFRDAREAEGETEAVRTQLADANARLVEERHDSDYWRGLANWYSDHPGSHPSQDECEVIAKQVGKWMYVGTPSNPMVAPRGELAWWSTVDELTGRRGE